MVSAHRHDTQNRIQHALFTVLLLQWLRLIWVSYDSDRLAKTPFSKTIANGCLPDMTLEEIRRVLQPPNVNESAIEDSPPSSRDGPSTQTASTAEAPPTTNGHITIHSPQRSELSPLKTSNPYTPGRQSEMTPFPDYPERMSPSELSPSAETSSRTQNRLDVPNTAFVRPDTPNPAAVEGDPSTNGVVYSNFTPPTSPGTQPHIRQETDRHPSIAFRDTPSGLLALGRDNAANQQEHESLARARTEPQDPVSRHEDSSSLRQVQSAGNSAKDKRVKLSEAARRKADIDEKWRKEMGQDFRASVVNEAHGGKRKASDVGMHKPLVKAAKKYGAKVKEAWLDTTTGKTHKQREATRAVQKARKISQEVHGEPAEKSRLASVHRRLSRRASNLFSPATWDRSADDAPTNDSASPAVADADQSERRRLSSFAGSMRGSIGNLASRIVCLRVQRMVASCVHD